MNTAQPDSRQVADALADYLADLDAVTPRDGDDLLLVEQERWTVETLRHFAYRGLLTPDGLVEATRILAPSGEWVQGLPTSRDLPPRP